MGCGPGLVPVSSCPGAYLVHLYCSSSCTHTPSCRPYGKQDNITKAQIWTQWSLENEKTGYHGTVMFTSSMCEIMKLSCVTSHIFLREMSHNHYNRFGWKNISQVDNSHKWASSKHPVLDSAMARSLNVDQVLTPHPGVYQLEHHANRGNCYGAISGILSSFWIPWKVAMQVFYSDDYSVDEGIPLQEGWMCHAFSVRANQILLWSWRSKIAIVLVYYRDCTHFIRRKSVNIALNIHAFTQP